MYVPVEVKLTQTAAKRQQTPHEVENQDLSDKMEMLFTYDRKGEKSKTAINGQFRNGEYTERETAVQPIIVILTHKLQGI